MSTLRTCLKKLGVSEHEAAILRGAATEYREDGMAAQAAAVQAVQDLLRDLQAERLGILAQVRAQGVEVPETVDEAAAETEPPKSIAQADAGNYQKGKFDLEAGMTTSIETPAGERRNPDWPPLQDHYGYLLGTIGADKEHLDIFWKPGTPLSWSGTFYVVNQVTEMVSDESRSEGGHRNKLGFDEHKVMGGYASAAEARAAYLRNYEEGWEGLGSMIALSTPAFKSWAYDPGPRGPKFGALTKREANRREEEAKQAVPHAAEGSDSQQGGSAPERDLFTKTDLPGSSGAQALDRIKVIVEKQRSTKLPAGLIRTPEDAARAFRDLNTWPRERFQMIGLDAKDRPIAFYDLFAGTLGQTSVYPREVWLALYQTPGVRGVWFAHNHPSGVAVPSSYDIDLNDKIKRLLQPGMGVAYKGHVIIAGDQFIEIDRPSGQPIPPVGERFTTVPVLERKILNLGPPSMRIGSSDHALEVIRKIAPTEPGLVLLDYKNRPSAWWPMSLQSMVRLAMNEGIADTLRMVGEKNPGAALVYGHNAPIPEVARAALAIRDFLDGLEVRVLDAISLKDGQPASLRDDGQLREIPGAYHLSGRPAGVTPRQVERDLKDHPLYTPLADRIRIVPNAFHLPQAAIDDLTKIGGINKVRGHVDPTDGTIYLIAGNMEKGDAPVTLLHEVVGHVGLENVLGQDFINVYLDIYRSRQGDIMAEVHSGVLKPYGFDLHKPMHKARAASEWIAHQAEQGREATLWQKVVAAVRAALRKLGFVREWSDADILRLLQLSHSSLTAGAQRTYNGAPAYQQVARGPLWYSKLEQAVAAKGPGQAPAAQWLQFLGNQPGLSKDELAWTGVTDWLALQPGKVTKADVQAFLAENGVKVEEVMLGASQTDEHRENADIQRQMDDLTVQLDALGYAVYSEPTGGPDGGEMFAGVVRRSNLVGYPYDWTNRAWLDDESMDGMPPLPEEVRQLGEQIAALDAQFRTEGGIRSWNEVEPGGQETRFDTWQLPGGTNYRELLLTLPQATRTTHTELQPPFDEVETPTEAVKFQSSHFNEPNIIAHVRFNERTDTDGKRVLFVEEIQSDWAQKGKRDGFVNAVQREDALARIRNARARLDANPHDLLAEADLRRADELFSTALGVHSAPFVTKTDAWVSLVLKRMIRYAAENGFARVSWTTGDQQADRYDLSKQVGRVVVERNGTDVANGKYLLKSFDQSGKQFHSGAHTAQELPDIVGKDLADKIVADVTRAGGKTYTGLDLKVGGEGMRAFYDKIVPNIANDVLKQVGGGRVGKVTINDERGRAADFVEGSNARRNAAVTQSKTAPTMDQPGFDITPEMRVRALAGMQLFSIRDLFSGIGPKPTPAAAPAAPLGDVAARPGVEFGRLNALLGAKLYGEPKDIGPVSVKELFQNSFDALKELIDNGVLKEGKIAIGVNTAKRTITITDNGAGMSAETLAGPFLRVAGTKKGTERASGGLGIAKGLFLYGNEHIRVETVHNGVLSVLDTTGPILEAAAAGAGPAPQITRTRTDRPSGTTVTVTVPKDYVEADSHERKEIHLSDWEHSYKVLKHSPLFSNIEVTFNGRVLEGIGKTFNAEEYAPFTTVKFKWGNATIYVSKEEKPEETKFGDNLRYLSNGLWQFEEDFKSNPFDYSSKRVPRILYVDIHPTVKAEDPGYPFDLNRQKLAPQVHADFSALTNYLGLVYRMEEAAKQADNFGSARYFDERGKLSKPQILRPERDKAYEQGLFKIVAGDKVEIIEGALKVNGRKIPVLTSEDLRKVKTDIKQLMIDQQKIDSTKPMLHENLDISRQGFTLSFSDAMREDLGPRYDALIHGVGKVFRSLADSVAVAMRGQYGNLEQYGVGISLDPNYRGVWIRGPFQGMFINPASTSKGLDMGNDPVEYANAVFMTMVHEIAHHAHANHGPEHVAATQQIIAKILSNPKLDAIRRELIDLYVFDWDAVRHINEAFKNEPVSAPGVSLATGENEERIEGTPSRERGLGDGRAGPSALRGDDARDRRAGSSGLNRGLSPEGEARLDGLPPAYSLRSEPTATTVYGVREGRVQGMARRAYQGGVWEVYLANRTNESLFTGNAFRRVQASTIAEVQRIFNTAGLEMSFTTPQNVPIPDRSIFDRDWIAPKADTWLRRSIIYFQNRLLLQELYERTIERELGPIPENAKAHREARIAHPRAAGKIADFDHDYTERVIDLMKRNKLSLREVGEYLYALHAPERNAAIEEINPDNVAGSGMSNDRANAILAGVQPAKLGPLIEIARIAREIVRFREQVLIDKGLVKRDVVELLRQKYPNYVPLKEIAEDEHIQGEVAGGFRVGKLLNTAFGRFTEAQAEYILPGLIAQAKGTIAAGENAEVLRSFLRLVSYAPNPQVWKVKRTVSRPYIDRQSGEVRYAQRPLVSDAASRGHVIEVPVNGDRHTIEVADDRIATALTTSGLPLSDALQVIGSITRFYALGATAMNPEFVVTNFMRDFQQAMLRISGEQNPKLAMKVARDAIPALWGALSGLRAKGQYAPGAAYLGAETWHRWYRRYIEAGGHIAYRGIQDPVEEGRSLAVALADAGIYPTDATGFEKVKLRSHRIAKVSGAKAAAHVIMDVNGAVENALRLSAFKNAVESGWTEKDAAMLARSVTVDFNLKGEAGARMGALFMFFNANLQGSALLLRSIVNNRGIQVAALLLFALGAGMDWWNREHGKETKEGRNAYDDIAADIKERNLVIMAPDGVDAITVPLPFGFNVFYNAGVLASAVKAKAMSPLDAAGQMFVTTVNAFSTFGQSPTSLIGALQFISPTIADAFVQAATNRKFNERPIYPERPKFAAPQADASTYFPGTPQHYVDVAQWLNRKTGGNEIRSGRIDVSPNMLQHWANSIFSSSGAFYARAFGIVGNVASDRPTEIREIPFVRRFYYESRDFELSHRFYANVNATETAHLEVQKAYEANDTLGARVLGREYQQERQLYGEAQQAERRVSEIRAELGRVRRQPNWSDERKKLAAEKMETQSRETMMQFNRRFAQRVNLPRTQVGFP